MKILKYYSLKIEFDFSYTYTNLIRIDKIGFEIMSFDVLKNLYELVYDEWWE